MGMTSEELGGKTAPLWLVDWSDSEHEDFLWACETAGVAARVLRAPERSPKDGLGSWRSSASLARLALRQAGGAPLVVWHTLAGPLAGIFRRGRHSRLLLIGLELDAPVSALGRKLLLWGAERADCGIFFSAAAIDDAVSYGLERRKLRFVPLGVRTTQTWSPPSGDYLLAVGRKERDWETLAKAAEGLECEVRVVGPVTLPDPGPLKLLPPTNRSELLELMQGARAIVVPLSRTTRSAGQMTVLDGISVGRAVITMRSPGVEDYVNPGTGILVSAGDVLALREALARLSSPVVAEQMGRAALAAARRAFSLERFIAEIDGEARSI
jgi:glycosyltransferase involved in cell wall biosynthesis